MIKFVQGIRLGVTNDRHNVYYQRCLNGHFSGFNLAAYTHVLSILGVLHYSHIPHALHLHCYLLSSVET